MILVIIYRFGFKTEEQNQDELNVKTTTNPRPRTPPIRPKPIHRFLQTKHKDMRQQICHLRIPSNLRQQRPIIIYRKLKEPKLHQTLTKHGDPRRQHPPQHLKTQEDLHQLLYHPIHHLHLHIRHQILQLVTIVDGLEISLPMQPSHFSATNVLTGNDGLLLALKSSKKSLQLLMYFTSDQ